MDDMKRSSLLLVGAPIIAVMFLSLHALHNGSNLESFSIIVYFVMFVSIISGPYPVRNFSGKTINSAPCFEACSILCMAFFIFASMLPSIDFVYAIAILSFVLG